MKKWPRWPDEDAVYRAVEEEFTPPDDLSFESGLAAKLTIDVAVRVAEHSAHKGNFHHLAALLHDPKLRALLSPPTWQLIAARLSDQRGGGKPGPKKKSEAERRSINPVHDAADWFKPIHALLCQHYPTQSPRALRDRAYAFAARFVGWDDARAAQGVRDYLNASRNHRKRLPPD